jgi:predicted transcriptional regulator of viral defense system
MGDGVRSRPDHACLFEVASSQNGHFTAEQGRVCGFSWEALSHHAASGRFVRVRRGLYRLRDYPTSPREEVVAAWLAVGRDRPVVSHDSALELLQLSDVIPDAVHLTVPRTRRHLPKLPGVRIHTSRRALDPDNVTVREGIRLTGVTRTILDAAEAGTAPEQLEAAIVQAIGRGMVTPRQLEEKARERSRRVAGLVADALRRAER